MSIERQYARASISSNLKCDEKHSDTDVLMAVALCGVPLGPLLLRAKLANDAGSVYELKRAWLDVVAKTAFMKSWPDKVSVKKVVATSLEYWLNDTCPECTGRKADQIDGTPCLSGVDCAACNGSGKRPIPCDAMHVPYVEAMVYGLEATVLNARNGANDKIDKDR